MHFEQSFLSSAVDILSSFSWIYDLNMTELFCHDTLSSFPESWNQFFRSISYTDLDAFILTKTEPAVIPIPMDLKQLIDDIKNLEFISRPEVYEYKNLSQNNFVGLSVKKQHEISVMVPFISDLCNRNEITNVVDIGSGLGYFDKHLVANSDIKVVGIEKKSNFVQSANKRQEKSDQGCSVTDTRIINLSYTISEDSEHELISLVRSRNINGPLAMVSLHSCGDLTPSMLRLFVSNQNRDLNMLVAFSCCYHSMHKDESGFNNFPMSKCLEKILSTKADFNMSVFGMRLACQQDLSTLLGKSKDEHDQHIRHVAYRAILQKFCVDRGLSIKKLKRKLAVNKEFNNFEAYTNFVTERINFINLDNTLVDLPNIRQDLAEYYEQYSYQFDLIEPLTLLIQPVLERLILIDRVCFLNEHMPFRNNRLVKVFNSTISPRCVCILSE